MQNFSIISQKNINHKHTPNISVAIATYNGELYLEEQLASILQQTLMPNEIIIVDDVSLDNTWHILTKSQKLHPIIKIYRNQQNIGPTKTFEKAVNICSGDYVALSDQDDVWVPTKLEKLIEQIGTAGLIHSDATIINAKGQIIHPSLLKYLNCYPIENFFIRLTKEGVHGCCMMMTKHIANLARNIPNGFTYHDFFYNLVAAANGEIVTTLEPLIAYRLHNNNICGLDTDSSYTQMIKDYAKNLYKMQLIIDLPLFSKHKQDIQFYIDYYTAIISHKSSTLEFIKKTHKLLGIRKSLALIAINLFGECGIKISYNILNFVRKIKTKT